jgi:PAS domain S-box-containing protein
MEDHSKRAEEFAGRLPLSSQEMAELHATLLEGAPVSILVYDQDGDCLLANERAAHSVGATRSQLLEQNFNRISSWEVSGLLAEARVCLERAESRRSQIHTTTTFGREVWLDCRLVPLGTAERRRVLLTFEDVTERKRAEAEAQRHERTLQAINRLFRDALVCGLPSEVAHRFADIAQGLAFARTCWLFELDSEGVLRTVVCPPGSAPSSPPGQPAGVFKTVMETGRSSLVNRAAGHPADVGLPACVEAPENYVAVPLRRGDGVFGVALLANRSGPFYDHDLDSLEALAAAYTQVRDRREADARLKATVEDLSRSNEDLGLFASVASHDLREPLRKILLFGERLENALASSEPGRAAEFLGRMLGSARRLRTLVDGVLEYSRAGTTPARVARVDMDALLRGVVADLEVALEECAGRVELSLCPAVRGDAVQLRQVFQNLIQNSIVHRREGVAPRIRVTAMAEGGSVRIEVADNGNGFDPSDADRIFLPFCRVGASASSSGMGMGLAVVRRLTRRNQGTVTARGTPGQGAVFSLSFPGAEVEQEVGR